MASGALMNMAFVFGIVQIADKYKLDAPENTPYLRLSYALVQVVSVLLMALIYVRIKSKNGILKINTRPNKVDIH